MFKDIEFFPLSPNSLGKMTSNIKQGNKVEINGMKGEVRCAFFSEWWVRL